MSNLKKILALVLALVMSFSLVSVSSAAFADADDFTAVYTEAAEVLEGVGVIKGRGQGKFEPQATITRAEVAAMIYRAVTGDVDDKQADLYVGAANFTDVPANAWYAGYVGFCANGKYVRGYGDGSFKPMNTVTGYEALVMVLQAIGYGKVDEFTGPQWSTNAATRAKLLGITNNIASYQLTGPATRELVAEIVYRAIMVPQAEFTPALSYHLKDISLGYQTFGLTTFTDAVVMANEEANLYTNANYGEYALAANRTEVNYIAQAEDGEYYWYNKTLAGTTGLDDLGESRYIVYIDANNVKDRTVLYIADSGLNTVYETGEYVKAGYLPVYAKAAGVAFGNYTAEYVDFEPVADDTITGNVDGIYVKVIDNDDDGIADYVLKTNYLVDEVYSVSAKGAVTFYNGNGYNATTDNLVAYEGIAAGDVVIYTNNIDGNIFCELADSFTGITTTVSYKNDTITVDGTEYSASAIANLTDYDDDIMEVEEKTEYTYFMDKFGFIACYKLPESAASEYALLTEAYLTKSHNDAWITKTTPIAEVTIQDGDMAELVVANYKTKGGYFFTATTLGTNVLLPAVPGAVTNIAAIGGASAESINLATAYEEATGKNGAGLGYAAVDYVALDVQNITKADKQYTGTYGEDAVVVNAIHNTEYYFVDKTNEVITYVVDYTEVPAIPAELIDAAYAVASNVSADADTNKYWVADVVVIELNDAIPGVFDTIDLVYYNNSKTTAKVYNLDVIDVLDPALGANIYVNKVWADQMTAGIPGFYKVFNTEKEYVKVNAITENFNAYGIFAGTIDRIEETKKLGDYIVLTNGKTVATKDVPVFVVDGKYTAETTITATRYDQHDNVLADGNEGDNIIYVCNPFTGALSYIVLTTYTCKVSASQPDGIYETEADALWAEVVAEQDDPATSFTGLDALLEQIIVNYDADMTAAQIVAGVMKSIVVDPDLRAAAEFDADTMVYYSVAKDVLDELKADYTDSAKANAAVALLETADKPYSVALAEAKIAAFALVNKNVAKSTGFTADWSAWTAAQVAAVKEAIDAATTAAAIAGVSELEGFKTTYDSEVAAAVTALATAKTTAITALKAALLTAAQANADAAYLTTAPAADAVNTACATFITTHTTAINALTVKADVEAYVAGNAAAITAEAAKYVTAALAADTVGTAKKAAVAEIKAMAKSDDYASATAMTGVTAAINTGVSNVMADNAVADITAEVAATKTAVAAAAVAAAKTAVGTSLALVAGSTNDVDTVTATLVEKANKDVTITVTLVNGYETEAYYSIVITSKLDATKTATVADYVVTVAAPVAP